MAIETQEEFEAVATLHLHGKAMPYLGSSPDVLFACDCHPHYAAQGDRTGLHEIDGECWPVYKLRSGLHREWNDVLAVVSPEGVIRLREEASQ